MSNAFASVETYVTSQFVEVDHHHGITQNPKRLMPSSISHHLSYCLPGFAYPQSWATTDRLLDDDTTDLLSCIWTAINYVLYYDNNKIYTCELAQW